MSVKPKRIGIFGGTFDPVHNGHLSIAKSFLNSKNIDELWVLLNPDPPHKPDEQFTSFKIRLKMLKAAFQPFKHTLISDLEQHLPTPVYTVQTVTYLTRKYPYHTFYLCMGKDSFINFKNWHKWKDILNKCSLLVADRSVAEDDTKLANLKKKATFVDHEPLQVSSTEVRNRIKKGKPVHHLVPENVLAIIKNEHLYTER